MWRRSIGIHRGLSNASGSDRAWRAVVLAIVIAGPTTGNGVTRHRRCDYGVAGPAGFRGPTYPLDDMVAQQEPYPAEQDRR